MCLTPSKVCYTHLVLLHVVERGEQGHIELLDENVLLRLREREQHMGTSITTHFRTRTSTAHPSTTAPLRLKHLRLKHGLYIEPLQIVTSFGNILLG